MKVKEVIELIEADDWRLDTQYARELDDMNQDTGLVTCSMCGRSVPPENTQSRRIRVRVPEGINDPGRGHEGQNAFGDVRVCSSCVESDGWPQFKKRKEEELLTLYRQERDAG